MMKQIYNKNGFTLIEMLIVVTIIGILASLTVNRIMNSSDTAEKNVHRSNQKRINKMIELFFINTQSFPTAMTETGWTTTNATPLDYFQDGVPSKCRNSIPWTFGTNNLIDPGPHSSCE